MRIIFTYIIFALFVIAFIYNAYDLYKKRNFTPKNINIRKLYIENKVLWLFILLYAILSHLERLFD